LNSILTNKWTKPVVFSLCLVPFGVLLWRIWHSDLGANPVQFVEFTTGRWTLRFLVITLAITPARKILRMPQLIRFRRMFGLFAFFYVCLVALCSKWSPLLRRPRRGCRLRFREWRLPGGCRTVAAIKWASLGIFSALSPLAGYSFST
jgi:hypothetical protein